MECVAAREAAPAGLAAFAQAEGADRTVRSWVRGAGRSAEAATQAADSSAALAPGATRWMRLSPA
eukprot:12981355-Alexandrium_andersonii.AAC.1